MLRTSRGDFVRRMPAEVVANAISQATGVFNTINVADTSVKVKYVTQARSSEDLGGKDLQPMRDLLVSFAQGNRDKAERDPSGNMVQASVLLNGQFVKERIRMQEGGRLWKLQHSDPPLSPEQITDEMFLAFLSRFPRPEEKAVTVNLLDARKSEALEDLAWSLINKIEFIHNY